MKSLLSLLVSLALSAPVSAEPLLEAAISLYKEEKFTEARALLEKLAAAEPDNAEVCYYLGMAMSLREVPNAVDDALPWLEKAVKLKPDDPRFLAHYGGNSLEYASLHSSLSASTKGRDALEKAISLEPNDLEAREALFQFYLRAPWPLGNHGKAKAQLAEISKRDADKGAGLDIMLKVDEKKYDEAFQVCDQILAKDPENYLVLYQYGRTASFSGKNLERGVECLKKVLTLKQPSPTAPKPTHAQYRLGTLQEQLGRRAEAKQSYELALKLDPTNKPAEKALARVSKDG